MSKNSLSILSGGLPCGSTSPSGCKRIPVSIKPRPTAFWRGRRGFGACTRSQCSFWLERVERMRRSSPIAKMLSEENIKQKTDGGVQKQPLQPLMARMGGTFSCTMHRLAPVASPCLRMNPFELSACRPRPNTLLERMERMWRGFLNTLRF